ncbi:MAG: IS66 family transposase [Paracoccaceae bacterium]
MLEIQETCAQLQLHEDLSVACAAKYVLDLDKERELDHQASLLEKDQTISLLSVEKKALTSDVELLKFHLKNANANLFDAKSEKSKSKPRNRPQNNQKSDETDDDHTDGKEAQEGKITPKTADKGKRKDGKKKKPFPEHLPRRRSVIDPDPAKLCDCGCERRSLPHEIVERLEFVPAEVVVIQEIYNKSVCRNCGHFAYANRPNRLFEQSRYGTSMTVAALMDKFADGLPYYRQATRFDRMGFPIDRSTLMRWGDRGADALRPLYELMLDDLRRTIVLGMDETPLPQLDPGRGKVKTGYLWTLMRDPRNYAGNEAPCAIFKYAGSRAGLSAEEMLDGFTGKLHVDAYAGYNRLTAADRPDGSVELSYCWAHVRRKFKEIMRTSKNDLAAECIRLIDAMFAIERDIKGKPALVRQTTRQLETQSIVDEVFELMKQSSFVGLKKSPMGKALAYALTLEDGLRLFLNDGLLEISNNSVENIIRHVAIVRKNALFAGSEAGGENWAIAQSIIATCKLNDLNPEEYLKWVFDKMEAKLPRSRYHELLPWNCPLRRNRSKK